MNTHGIPAAVWQLQAAKEGQLKAIVLPLEKYVEKPLRDLDLLGQGKAAKDGDGDWILWFLGEDRQEVLDKITLDFYPKGLKEGIIIPFKDGDRIFLQEEWDYFLDKLEGELCYPLKRTSPMYPCGWQPAEAMPPEAAQYWYEVKKVRVMQAKDVAILSTSFSSGHSSPILILEEWTKYWNAAYPEQVWNDDRWVVVLDVEAIAP
jgi:hypothetical protein